MEGNSYGTTYTETEALIAALEDDEDDLNVKLEAMNEMELLALRDAANLLRNACDDVRRRKRRQHPVSE